MTKKKHTELKCTVHTHFSCFFVGLFDALHTDQSNLQLKRKNGITVPTVRKWMKMQRRLTMDRQRECSECKIKTAHPVPEWFSDRLNGVVPLLITTNQKKSG